MTGDASIRRHRSGMGLRKECSGEIMIRGGAVEFFLKSRPAHLIEACAILIGNRVVIPNLDIHSLSFVYLTSQMLV